MKYFQVHYVLKQKFGPAREHTCSCGAKAAEWAYQHTGVAMFDENFQLWYSEDLSDYAPMCLSCHNKLDVRLEHMSRAGKLGMAAADTNPVMKLHKKALSLLNRTARRRCSCGFVSVRTGMGRHQQVSGHVGFEDVE